MLTEGSLYSSANQQNNYVRTESLNEERNQSAPGMSLRRAGDGKEIQRVEQVNANIKGSANYLIVVGVKLLHVRGSC